MIFDTSNMVSSFWSCATEWRKNGIPLDIVARLLGHSKTETTEKRYVKYEQDMLNTVRKLM